jgi:diaminopropionate ammonia-lyase
VFRSERGDGGIDEPPVPRDALRFHRKLPGYAPTPLLEAPEIAGRLGLRHLWMKDETTRFDLPSFKFLGASWGTYRALDAHAGGLGEWETLDDLLRQLAPRLPLSLSAATDGNHGRAVARMARMLGLTARVYVPAGTAPARIEAIESEGAACEIVQGTYGDAVARSARDAGPRCLVVSDTSWPGYEDVPRFIVEGYSTIFEEIDGQLPEAGADGLEMVVIQIGVGALAAAAARHYRRPGLASPPTLVGVEPESAACMLASVEAGEIVAVPGPHRSIMAGLNCDRPSLVAFPLVSRSFDLFVTVTDDQAEESMRVLAELPLESGETGAAGLAGLLRLFEHGPDGERGDKGQLGVASALVIVTEGVTDPEGYRRAIAAR